MKFDEALTKVRFEPIAAAAAGESAWLCSEKDRSVDHVVTRSQVEIVKKYKEDHTFQQVISDVLEFLGESKISERRESPEDLAAELLYYMEELEGMEPDAGPRAQRLIRKILQGKRDIEKMASGRFSESAKREGVITVATVILQIFKISVRLSLLMVQSVRFGFEIPRALAVIKSSAKTLISIIT